MRLRLLLFVGFILSSTSLEADWPKEQRHFWDVVQPIMEDNCNRACHNADDRKGGLNLDAFSFIVAIQRRGEIFVKLIDHVENGTMPPDSKPPLSKMEKDTLLFYIKKYIKDALEKPDPGLITSRRLSNQEYEYAIQDLTGVIVNTDSLLPRDPGGGEGFDNFARTLYITPLLMERYFDIGESVIEQMNAQKESWRQQVPENSFSIFQRIKHWWYRWIYHRDLAYEATIRNARDAIGSFATLAYRRYLTPQERDNLIRFFEEVYRSLPDRQPPIVQHRGYCTIGMKIGGWPVQNY